MYESSLAVVTVDYWLFSILVPLGIFVIILASYVVSLYFSSVEVRRLSAITELDPNVLDDNALDTTTVGQNILDPLLMRTRAMLSNWSKVATKAYVAMVLSCAALYIASEFLSFPRPLWYRLVLTGFPFVSAYLVYRVWSKVRED